MGKTYIQLIAIALFLGFGLFGCSCSNKGANQGTDAESIVNSFSTETTNNRNAQGKLQIRWFVGLGIGSSPAQVEIQQAVVDTFNKTNDQIELVLEVVPYDSAMETLSSEIQDGNGPDLVGPVGIGNSNFFHDQWLDLTPLIEDNNFDTSIYNQTLIEFHKTGGHQIGLPFAVFPSGLFFQKPMFDQAGLNYPPAKIGDLYVWPDGTESEWNWETLTEVAKRLTLDVNGHNSLDKDFDRDNIVQTGFHPQWASLNVIGTFFGTGLTYETSNNKYNVKIPEAWKSAWRWWFDGMWGNEPFIANGVLANSPEFGGGNVFNAQKTAMTETQLWYVCCLSKAGSQWDIGAFPSYEGEYHGRFDARTFYIWKGTQNPDAAFKVLTYLIGPDGVVPLLLGDKDHPGGAYDAFPALPAYQQVYLENKAVLYPQVDNWDVFLQGLNYPDIPSAEAWMPNMSEALKRIVTFGDMCQTDSTIDFEAELDRLEADLQEIMNK
jgi:multiple sugar transport system substrate-binding protein